MADQNTKKLSPSTKADLRGADRSSLLKARADRLAFEQTREGRLAAGEARRASGQFDETTAKGRAQKRRFLRAGGVVVEHVDKGITPLVDKVSNASTVGGIGLLVAIIVFLLFVVVQVNAAGDTRLKQLWYMLNGRAKLEGAVFPTGGTAGTPGSTADPGVPLTPTDPSGNCPTGFHVVIVSGGKRMCQPDLQTTGAGGGDVISPMVLYPMNGNLYRPITGNSGF